MIFILLFILSLGFRANHYINIPAKILAEFAALKSRLISGHLVKVRAFHIMSKYAYVGDIYAQRKKTEKMTKNPQFLEQVKI